MCLKMGQFSVMSDFTVTLSSSRGKHSKLFGFILGLFFLTDNYVLQYHVQQEYHVMWNSWPHTWQDKDQF